MPSAVSIRASDTAVRPTGEHDDGVGELRANVLDLVNLAGMSVSSVGPVFSIAAAVGPMIAIGFYQAPVGMLMAFVPFLISALVFRHLNRHIPNAGASYGWTFTALGPIFGLIQGWAMILAYFFSLLAIIVPAGTYTLTLLSPSLLTNTTAVSLVGSAWAIFAAIPLIWGIRPTARFTAVFLTVEVVVIGAFYVLGVGHIALHGTVTSPALSWFLPLHGFKFGHEVLVGVVAFTIVDGWELDAHASEESKRRRTNPGTGGLIGLLAVTILYVMSFLLFFTVIPLRQLVAHQNNVLAYFAQVVTGSAWGKLMIVGILASTASGLWLTHFILNRTLFAMSRDGIISARVGRVHPKFLTPWLLVVIVTAAEVTVNTGLLISPTVSSFFNLVLQAAGLFLGVVFVFSNIAAVLYFRRVSTRNARHFVGLFVAPLLAVAGMVVLIAGFISQQKPGVDLSLALISFMAVPFIIQAKLRGVDVMTANRQLAVDFAHPEDDELHVAKGGQLQAHAHRHDMPARTEL